MSLEFFLLVIAIVIGASVQVGVGIGFSIVVAPIMMVMLGTATAVPVLLLLNTLVSVLATNLETWRCEKTLIRQAVIGCVVGIVLGLIVYPYLSEPLVLILTASLLLIGVMSSLLPMKNDVKPLGFIAILGLSGLATVWAATPGPLMVLGLLAIGRSAHETRKLVQPVALVAYGSAFILHYLSNSSAIGNAPWLWQFAIAAFVGSLIGRHIGPRLPQKTITHSIRVISAVACIALFRRAFLLS